MIAKPMLFFISLLSLVSCSNPKGSSLATKETVISSDIGRIDLYSNLNDTVLLSKNIFLVYEHVSIDSFRTKWGKVNNVMVYCDTLPIFASGLPILAWHNNNTICLTQGCGTDCYFAYILLFKTGEIKTYMYPLAYDTANNIIVCAGDNYDSKVFLVVENFLTGEKKEIIEDYLPGPPGYAIESINFNQSGLLVKWRDSQDKMQDKVFK